jgi:hypothetical protein
MKNLISVNYQTGFCLLFIFPASNYQTKLEIYIFVLREETRRLVRSNKFSAEGLREA